MEAAGDGIPVIDLNDFPGQSKKLLKACEEWGCFKIINHKIPQQLMLDVKIVFRSLLDLPMEIKQRNTDVILGTGYLPPTKEDPLYQALSLYDLGSPDAVDDFCNKLDTSLQQREIIKSYSSAIHDLAIEMAGKLAESMGVDSDMAKGWPCLFRINKYSFTEESVGSNGVAVHADSGFLTILQQDDSVRGLEVMDKSTGEFIDVEPSPGSLFINIGDIATAWSNGRLCNVLHRVQCKEAATRVSIALLLMGPKEAVVEAPSKFVDSENPRLYRPFQIEEYRTLRISTGLRCGETLDFLRLETSN